MTESERPQDYEEASPDKPEELQEEIQEETEETRSTLMDRVLDFVAPQDKGKHRVQTAPPKPSTERSKSYFAKASSKSPNPLLLSPSTSRFLGLVLLTLCTVNLVAFSSIATNRFFALSGNLIYFFRLDTVTFHLNTLLEIQVIFSLILSAVLGGLCIHWLLKFTIYLSKTAGLSVQRRHVTYILGALTILFLVFFLISIIGGNSCYTYETFHYLAPFLTYASGLAIYSLSQLRFEV